MNPTAGEQQRKEKNIEEQNLRVARSLEWKEKVEGKSGRGGGTLLNSVSQSGNTNS